MYGRVARYSVPLARAEAGWWAIDHRMREGIGSRPPNGAARIIRGRQGKSGRVRLVIGLIPGSAFDASKYDGAESRADLLVLSS